MRNSSPSTILIIEDDPTFRETLVEVLREDGHRLLSAGAAREAMGLLEQELPELIVLDLMMPGINGQQLSRLLKGNPRTAKVPVLALSGAGPEAVLEAEVDWYLAKPVEVQILLSTVRHLIQRELPAAV